MSFPLHPPGRNPLPAYTIRHSDCNTDDNNDRMKQQHGPAPQLASSATSRLSLPQHTAARVARPLPSSCKEESPSDHGHSGESSTPHAWKQAPSTPRPTEQTARQILPTHTALCPWGTGVIKKDEAELSNPQLTQSIHSKTRPLSLLLLIIDRVPLTGPSLRASGRALIKHHSLFFP